MHLPTLFKLYVLGAPLALSPDAGSDLRPTGPLLLHPNGDRSKCLDVRGAALKNGTAVQIFDCNNTPAQQWVLNRGPTKVKLFGTDFCLDSGSGNPPHGTGMKIWKCFDDLPAQAWNYGPDNTIFLQTSSRDTPCLDVPNGKHINGIQVQTWRCWAGDTNQIWTVDLPAPTISGEYFTATDIQVSID